MLTDRNPTAGRMGFYSAALTAFLLFAYAVSLLISFFNSSSPEEPISGPLFTLLEILIILMMPAMVVVVIAVNARTPVQSKILSQIFIVSMAFLILLPAQVENVDFRSYFDRFMR